MRLKVILIVLASGVMITGIVGWGTVKIASSSAANSPLFFDPAAYSFYNAKLFCRLSCTSRSGLAWSEWIENGRHPLRTIPLIFAAPSLLASPVGHLATSLPMLITFLMILGWTVYYRTKNAWYSVACMVLFCSMRQLLHPVAGLPPNWLDLPAAFLTGSASLCLLNAVGRADIRWLAAFSVLGSLATLSRWAAGGYLLVMCAPVLGYYLWCRFKAERSFVRSVLKPIGIVVAITGPLVGYFLVAHFKVNMDFYATYGYALGNAPLTTIVRTIRILTVFVGPWQILILSALFVANVVLMARKPIAWPELLLTAWLGFSHLLFITMILRTTHQQAILYAVPPLFLLAVAPLSWKPEKYLSRASQMMATSAICVGVLLQVCLGIMWYQKAGAPTPEEKESKEIDLQLARFLGGQGKNLVWCAWFDERSWIPSLECFRHSGILLLPAGQDYFFSVHESVFRGNYPGLTQDEICPLIYRNALQNVDVAVVFDNPEEAEARFDNAYSRAVAKYVAIRIRHDQRWKKVFFIETRRYGTLAGYRNLSLSEHAHYFRRLDCPER
jgi:hypothetical protein